MDFLSTARHPAKDLNKQVVFGDGEVGEVHREAKENLLDVGGRRPPQRRR